MSKQWISMQLISTRLYQWSYVHINENISLVEYRLNARGNIWDDIAYIAAVPDA